MRNLKKILALVLALMMTLSLMVTANATSFTDDSKINSDYAEAAEVLTDIGIFQGDNKGQFLPDTTLNRKDASTLIYRIMTGDVGDKYVSNYAGYASRFSDVSEDKWYAPYVAYAALNGYIKGYDGKFNPDAPLTGIEVLTILLRAVGYDQKDEFSTDWVNTVAKQAQQVGISIPGVVLTAPVTREVAAELIFQVMTKVKMVEYTSALNYQPIIFTGTGVRGTQTLGQKIFSLSKPYPVNVDDWGRPGYEYKYTVNGKTGYTTFAIAAANSHNVKTSQCEIAEDLGEKKTFDVDVYDNGIVTKDVEFKATATTKNLGAQGTLIESYVDYSGEDRIVIIDTYLAQVTKVNPETTDSAGHVKDTDHSIVKVWGLSVNDESITTGRIETIEYAKGDYVLVNYNEETKEFEDVQAADSFDGKQSKIWYHASQHTINDKTYDDAVHYALDEAGSDGTVKYTWFLDQYGNLIGSVEIDRTSYAVLKDIIWEVGKPGYAQATLVYMDGSEDTVIVDEFDGITTNGTTAGSWDSSNDNEEPELDDDNVTFPGVSEDSKFNDLYEGYALYLVTTNDDGTVDLDGFDDNETYVEFDQAAMIDTDNHRIVTRTGSVVVDYSTEFLVNNGDGTYSAYTLSTVPSFADSAVIYYTVGSNNIATRVYVKEGVEKAELGNYLYVQTNNYYKITKTNDYYMTVVIDGVERTIGTTENIVKYLAVNVGKVFAVDWELNPYVGLYGFVDEARLVNETSDNYEGGINYLTGVVTFGNGVITATDGSYNFKDAVIVGAKSVDDETYKNKGVWVEYSTDGKQLVADVIYVGEKLDTSVALTVTAKDGTVVKDVDYKTNNTWNFTSKKDATSDELAYTANDANSVVIVYNNNNVEQKKDTEKVTETLLSPYTTVRKITVWNEAGTASETYTLTREWVKSSNDTSLKSVKVDGTDVTIPTGRTDPKAENAVYLDSKAQFTMAVTANSDAAKIEIGSGDTLDNAVKNLQARNSVTVTETTELNGGYIVIRVTAEDGSVQHYVYSTAAAPSTTP